MFIQWARLKGVVCWAKGARECFNWAAQEPFFVWLGSSCLVLKQTGGPSTAMPVAHRRIICALKSQRWSLHKGISRMKSRRSFSFSFILCRKFSPLHLFIILSLKHWVAFFRLREVESLTYHRYLYSIQSSFVRFVQFSLLLIPLLSFVFYIFNTLVQSFPWGLGWLFSTSSSSLAIWSTNTDHQPFNDLLL